MTLCRLQMTEAALALSEQKSHNMGEQLAQVKAEKEEQRERQSRDRKKEQEVLIDQTGHYSTPIHVTISYLVIHVHLISTFKK